MPLSCIRKHPLGGFVLGDGAVFSRGATRVVALESVLGRVSVWLGAILPVATPWARSEVRLGYMGVWHSCEEGANRISLCCALAFFENRLTFAVT